MSAGANGAALGRLMAQHLSGWPAPGAMGAIVGAQATGTTAATAGDDDRVFEWASVTKLLVGLSCLVALEEGTVGLEDEAGPPGSTLGHLLAHASGLPFEAERPVAPPGRRRIYSNRGIEVAAAHLAGRAGMPFEAYLHEAVLGPLGMAGTTLAGSPAHGARGPLADILALAAELRSPTLVAPETLSRATAVAWPGLSGVLPGFGRHDPCDWGFGPEVKGAKSPHWTGKANSPRTYGHFGQSGSFLWVDPDVGVAMAGLSAHPFGPWARDAWPAVSDAVLGSVGT